MKPKIRGSDVYVVEDIERILSALAGASRRYSGEYGSGYQDALRDVAAGVGTTVYERQVQEVARYCAERVIEHSAGMASPRFIIHGEREEWPAPECSTALPTLAETDVDFDDFVPGTGDLRRMEAGWMWTGNDGTKRFYPVQQWVELSADDARAMGYLIAENRRFIMAVRSKVQQRYRWLGIPERAIGERRQLK